jgi:manganese/iron transport system permease protein
MGIFFSGMFAFGLVLLSRIESDVHLMHVLFGNVLGIRSHELWESVIVSGLSMAILLLKRRDFLLYCFDPTQAHVSALSTRALHFSLLVLLALTIVSALKAAGIILVIAMLIAPGAIAHLLTRSFDRMLMVSVGVAVFSTFAGTLASFHFDLATAPCIVLTQSIVFVFAFTFSQPRSLAHAH